MYPPDPWDEVISMDDTHLLQFRCADIGIQCNASLRAREEEELMRQISKHAADVHGMLDVDDETMRKIKGAVRTVEE